MNPNSPIAQEAVSGGLASTPGMSIGELAERSGVQTATLRMWETRHGFPVAQRLPSGHRRYDERTVDQVRQVARRRNAGVKLEVAIAEVISAPLDPPSSVYAELRRSHPHLVPYRLRKPTLLALTWALEDECVARAQHPWLFGAFQDERYYRQAERRWRDLARTARGAWALGDFPPPPSPPTPHHAVEVALPADSPMLREWSLVCVAWDFPAALAAWELPGQEDVPENERTFESIWTLEAPAVRDAARACVGVISALGHDTNEVAGELDRPFSPVTTELRHATGLFNRMMSYVDELS